MANEFACPCCRIAGCKTSAIMALRELEAEWGEKLKITSSFRCDTHNKKIGGAPKSRHLAGDAFDILMPKSQQVKFVLLAQKHGFRGIGIGKTFVHIDMREKATAWAYA